MPLHLIMVESIDLRSDTVTLPTKAMREAMYRAEVGDDMMGEDPTMRRLEELAAEKVGKEAALFTISGTMGNLLALITHCGRGNEAAILDESHIAHFEGDGGAVLGGIGYRTLHSNWRGVPDLDELEYAISPAPHRMQEPGVVCLENTCNRRGGIALSVEEMSGVKKIADKYGVPVHLDGARVFNAATALGVDVTEIAGQVDTVMFCLSKGLSAPLGSMLCGSKDFVDRARFLRRLLGGNMRQAGVIAAAGIVALTEMVERLAEDHENAKVLAAGVADVPGIEVDLRTVETNIVIFRPKLPALSQEQVQQALADNGLLVSNYGRRGLRMLTHYGIVRDDIQRAIGIMHRVMKELAA